MPASLATAGCGVAVHTILYTLVAGGFEDGDTPAEVIAAFEDYTGLTHGEDAGFAEAAVTPGAQTGLSTFVSTASILLILFLLPPARPFASWTTPTPDKRPAVLGVVLLAILIGVLVTPALSDYLGLTGPAAVYETVLPALLARFVALSAAYRFRLLDRGLGLRLPG